MSRRAIHVPLLLVVISALVIGLWAALIRIGWSLPAATPTHVGLHGPIMAAGVFGTLIALERAVALAALSRHRLHPAYLPALVNAVGALGLLFLGATLVTQGLLALGAAGLLVVNLMMLRAQPTLHVLAMAVGAAFLAAANAAWLAGWSIPVVAHWWMAFIVLTIVGERLELARIRSLRPQDVMLFAVAAGGYVAALLLVPLAPDLGVRLAGVGMLALTAWLLRFDIAWITIRRPGLPGFVAACLLAGYAWLGVAGLVAVSAGFVVGGPTYDALLHAVFVGFGFSMVFGHAPIIFPAIVGVPIRFHPVAYLPLALLHTSVAARIVGDLAGDQAMRMQAGLLNVVAIVLYAVLLVAVIASERLGRRRAARG
jgi:hypothetical protein